METNADGSDPEGGFTMNFSVDIVDDVPAMVDEMMRLGDLGYFNEACEISNMLARHSDIFAVIAERMRLFLIQGAFQELLDFTDAVNLEGTATQTTILHTMRTIALLELGHWQSHEVNFAEVVVFDSALPHSKFSMEEVGMNGEVVSTSNSEKT